MGETRYNTGVNHIKSDGLLSQRRHPFSTDVRGIVTMFDHTPFFPENLTDYAPWVARSGLIAPYGKCQCGCGQDAPIAKQSDTRRFWRSGHPKKFMPLHGRKMRRIRKVSDSEAFWSHVDKTADCWVWTAGKHRHGYGWFYANQQHVTAHRFSYELHFGPIPSGFHVCHKCDNPCCVNPDHLFLGTHLDNMRDKVNKGRQHRGETTPGARFTEAQIREIRLARASGASQRLLAVQFGTSRENIRSIVNRETWAHVAEHGVAGVE